MSTIRTNAILDAAGGNTATINGITPALSSQAQAEAGTDNTTLMTPLRATQQVTARQATLAEAQAGTDNTKLMTPLRVADAITARVPANHVLLGTLTTTSGGTVTLSGLTLTGYTFLHFIVNGVSSNQTNSYLLLNGYQTIQATTGGTAGTGAVGGGFIDLATGVFWSSGSAVQGSSQTMATSGGGFSGITTASTSITFSITAGGTFDAGSIRIYGVR